MQGLLSRQGLTGPELEQIRELEAACAERQPLNMKLNWEMLTERPAGETNDFLYYEAGRLVGFLGLYGFATQPREIEATGMVHPDWRRRGIFGWLFAAAHRECQSREVERLLLISERASAPGIRFAEASGGQYAFSEYRMRFDGRTVPDFPARGLRLRQATAADRPVLQQIDAVCFGLAEDDSGGLERCQATYLAEAEGRVVGKIGLLQEGEDAYIFGFGIRPEFRGQGYGREALSLTLRQALAGPVRSVILEVAVQNERALSLYQSCGFERITAYDYYEFPL
ncbi:acetyltransferase (GNAT) family protein [Hydrogenispora ethanolica]|uniref:Acetyltransferase (GNAT) family protein n=1 Tax=Hydrogenispora ethanolica TaxID=1082276 RepID=A0A4R1QM82_HYDET|nr:GNAT family N-acetyltransferase [Hydrogenispora ethanolica]TCL54033.1 acetyltransferase (GNAT) family protein [Hydrogenispora ethanolica]